MHLEDALILIAKSKLPLIERKELIDIFLAAGRRYLALLKNKSTIPNVCDITFSTSFKQTETLTALGIIVEEVIPHENTMTPDVVRVHFPYSLLEDDSLDLINVLNRYEPTLPISSEDENLEIQNPRTRERFNDFPKNKYIIFQPKFKRK
ncbi:MAG TPA: hypothetical protein DCY94_05480 [Firmicutes bacterium]|nr:hypothetical protein [Bacillota bacterium]